MHVRSLRAFGVPGRIIPGFWRFTASRFSPFGAIAVSPLVKGPLGFRPVSLLFTVMAASIAAFALKTAGAQRSSRDGWFLIATGTASIAFAFSFIVVGFVKIIPRLEPPIFFSWMSSYFALCALFMLWLAFRAHSRGVRQSGQTGPFSPAPISTQTH